MGEEYKYLYFPGCSVKRDARNYELTAFDVFEKLGLVVKELDKWWCCGATFGLAINDLVKHIGSVRSLIEAEREGSVFGTNKLLTLCPMCFNVLKRVHYFLKNYPERIDRLRKYLRDEGLDYNFSIEVMHVLEVFYNVRDRIRDSIVRNGSSIKAAPYYGCTPLRPREIAIDNPEAPTIMDEILESMGVSVVKYPFKSECCGAYVSVYNRKVAIARGKMIIMGAYNAGANVLVTVCPLCHYNLMLAYNDFRRKPGLKIMYLTELMAYLMGLESHLSPDLVSYLDKLIGVKRVEGVVN